MKLEDYLRNNVNMSDVPEDFRELNLHVIGTCGDCKWWDSKAVSLDGWGNCDSYKVAAQTYQTDAKRHEDHGCIHWTKKEPL